MTREKSMNYFDPLIQMVLSLSQTPEEAEQLVQRLPEVDWFAMFALKAHCEQEIAQIQQYHKIQSTPGICSLCQAHLSKADMPSHIRTCLQQQEEQRARANSRMQPKFLLSVEGFDLPVYWGFVEVGQESRLNALDAILRRTWVDCCGHVSAFSIGDRRYESHDDPDEDWDPETADSMRTSLNRVLRLGMVFDYDYDFGETTSLTICVVDAYERKGFRGKSVPLVARNLPPNITCSICGQPATRVCPQCRDADTIGGLGWYCQKCARGHECGTEVLLPVTNSPRVGVCGYTGKTPRTEIDEVEEW